MLPEFRWTNAILYFAFVVTDMEISLSKIHFFVDDPLFCNIFQEIFPKVDRSTLFCAD